MPLHGAQSLTEQLKSFVHVVATPNDSPTASRDNPRAQAVRATSGDAVRPEAMS